MSKYLDYAGLALFKEKIMQLLGGKVDKTDGKGLSTHDYDANAKAAVDALREQQTQGGTLLTSEQAEKLAGIEAGATKYTHPVYTAQDLGLYKVRVDASGHVSSVQAVQKADILALGIDMGDLEVPEATTGSGGLMSAQDKAKLDAFSAAEDYALKSDIVGMYRFKGSVDTVSDLPAQAEAGDVWDVKARGINYAWTGEEWDALGELFAVDAITDSEIDALFQ